MPMPARFWASAMLLAMMALPHPAWAQRASDNAVANADDAFGTSVGTESSGIYTENDTRGFSPLKAGNVRIDGIYFDQVAVVPFRLRQSTTIRVGFAAQDFPFHAPTGIVEHKFRPWPTELGASVGMMVNSFGAYMPELDMRIPLIKDHLALTGGVVASDIQQSDGSGSFSWGATLRPIVRIGGAEISPFYATGGFNKSFARPVYVVTGDTLPKVPRARHYVGEDWASGSSANHTGGVTVKATLSGALSLRAGLFTSGGLRKKSFNEIFTLVPGNAMVRHKLIADPEQDVHSISGEAQVVWRFGQHRIFAGYRMRNRLTETGGSDVRQYGLAPFGEPDPHPEPVFAFTRVNAGRLRQSAITLGYRGRIGNAAALNLGVQKAHYRAVQRDGVSGAITREADDPWLYNATLSVLASQHLSFYVGSERGLEDSGIAPETATNRNAQLPATRSTQYEGGMRWKFAGGQLVLNAFQITKPYFSFDAGGAYAQVGRVRHRGVEASLSGKFGKRLSLLAGVLAMQPRVSGPARDAGLLGPRPTGTAALHARVDANYTTDIFGGLTPTVTVEYTGKRAVTGGMYASLGGRQLMEGSHVTVDLGLRQQFMLGRIPASVRAVVQNAFDHATWKVVASNSLQMDERRRFSLTLAADL